MEILLPEGRIVSGHPMKEFTKIDFNTKQPKLKDGKEVTAITVGVAIPKDGVPDWKQTPWGQQVVNAAQVDPVKGWANGETRRPDFSWKVIDGDSDIPNKSGNVPREQEGYAGNWVIFVETQIPYPCYHNGHYQPHECIQDAGQIKCGDYVRLYVDVVSNKPSQSPGVYWNPLLLSLDRVGEPIAAKVSAPVYNAATVFASCMAGAAPAPVAQPAPTPAPVAPAPVVPAHDLVTPPPVEERYSYGGQTLPLSEWCKMPGWTEAMIKQHGTRV